ncbi:MAG: LysR family transcriptional regulator [Parvibaculaceae bacterium]
MEFSLRQVEIFWAVATVGSVTGAARLLRTSQPTVSRELKRFEELCALRLFDRTGGRLKPTMEGLALFDEVRRSFYGVERIAHAAHAIRQFGQGQVIAACPPAIAQGLMPAAFRLFLDRYPKVSLVLHAQDSPVLEEWLTAQRYDIGLTDALQAPPGTRTETLASTAEVCVLPKGHPLAAKVVLHPRDFHGANFVHLAAEDPYRIQIDRVFVGAGIERRLTIETPSADALCRMVREGIGVAIVNPFTALAYAAHGVEVRRFAVTIPYVLSLVRPEHRPYSRVIEQFAGVLRESCDQAVARLNDFGLI